MNFTFTEEQLLIRDMAERFFRDEYDLDTRRKHQAMPGGFCPETWAQFAEMGWLALGIPEDLGGVGGGSVETAILMEAMGGGLAVEPFLSTVVLGGGLMIRGGSPEQQGDLLPKLAAGELLLAFGYAERKAMGMALVDRALRAGEYGEEVQGPAQEEEFVLMHCDNVEAAGFVSHLKLPHYVDFQAELELIRKLRRQAPAEENR